MKSSNSLSRIAFLLLITSAILMSTLAKAQDEPQIIHVNKKDIHLVTVQTIKTPTNHKHSKNNSTIHYISMEKSEKMEIVNPKEINVTAKQAARNKVAVIRKIKSEKIDQ